MSAGYTSHNWEVKVGDNVGVYSTGLLGIMGRGVGGMYKINSSNKIGAAVAAAMGTPLYSGTMFHEIFLPKGIVFKSSLTAIIDNYNRMNTYGASVQANYSFLPGHNVFLLLSPSVTKHNYDNQTFTDQFGNYITTVDPGATRYGFGAQFGYLLNRNKVNAALNVLFATKDYYQYYSGKLNVNGNATYFINKKYYLIGNSSIYLQNPRMYNQGVLYPENKYLAGSHKIEIAGRMTNKFTLFTGPVLDHLSVTSLKINRITQDSTYARFSTISPKLSIRGSYKNNVSGFINPYAMFGYTFITVAEDSSIALPILFSPRKGFFNAKAGINIIQSNWGLNVVYYIGPRDFITQSDYYYFGRYSKSLRIMPFFQKYYFNKTVLLSSYNSYYYEVGSNSERISLNANIKFFLEKDWTLFIDNNLYLSSFITEEGQKINSRSYFFSVGVKKVFDIPQPKVKYYDLKVICFKDINGNQMKDDDEQGLADIVLSIDRQVKIDSLTQRSFRQPGQFSPAEMVTDNFGQIIYYHIPEGEYNLHVFPLMNLKDLYNVNGQKQKITVSRKDSTYYVPFVQSYRVIGRIILKRDEYSSGGTISTANIRVTATDSSGYSSFALTSADGSYILYVPKAGEYTIAVNNVFGDQFSLQEGSYTVSFDGAKEFSVDFIFNEKKRSVNVNGVTTSVDTLMGRHSSIIVMGNDTIKDVTMADEDGKAIADSQTKKTATALPVGPGITYKVQLSARSDRVSLAQRGVVFKGLSNVAEYSEDGMYKYTTGDFKTIAEAKKARLDLLSKGFSGAFVVPFYKGSRVRY